MPWKARSVVEHRQEFIEQWLLNRKSKSELCREFGISRKTGYKIFGRFNKGGTQALEDWKRRPHTSPNKTPAQLEQRIVEHRAKHTSWGPKKLAQALADDGVEPPARSTIAAILKRHGLAHTPVCRQKATGSNQLIVPSGANELWCIDFKGWFRTGNGMRCDPLTMMDSWSRYLLCCHGLFSGTKTVHVREVFERVFERYGVPKAILSDNGSPWASTSAGGLTELSVWWIKLGILPLRIWPGVPQQNGRLERMHRTLKYETAMPPAMTADGQQERFDAFQHEYNHVRPHEALDLRKPVEFYTPSTQKYIGPAAGFEYPDHFMERRVYKGGRINLGDRLYMISKALQGEFIALEFARDAPLATIYLGDYVVGCLDLKSGKLKSRPRNPGLVRVGVPPPAPDPAAGNQPSLITATNQLPIRLSVLPMSLD
jgi:transposase InsO family protein